jgi:hypothetical protein
VTTLSKLDVRTSDGIIADGYYSFRNPDNSIFTSTFEATSYHTKKEIQYRLQKAVFFWDGLAISSVVTAALFSYGYTYNHFTIKQIGLLGAFSICILSLVTIMLIFRLFASQFHRYRYIYAIEQFKQYHADEQWIAYGEDVFENPDDKYLKEVKQQCVRNGFGLIKVDKKLEPHVLITPSRHEVFKGKRQVLSFQTQRKWLEKMEFENAPTWWRKSLNLLKNSGGPGSVLRFQKSFWNQVLVTLAAFSLMSVIFYREIQDADLIHVDRTTYLEDFSVSEKSRKEQEAGIFVVDTSVQVKVENQTWWDEDVTGKSSKGEEKAIENELPPKGRDIIVGQGNSAPVTYDCSRFYNLNGKKFIISDGIYGNTIDALERLVILESNGLTANILWLGCFSKEETDYAVYLNEFYSSEKEAQRELRELLKMDNVEFADLKTRSIELIEE